MLSAGAEPGWSHKRGQVNGGIASINRGCLLPSTGADGGGNALGSAVPRSAMGSVACARRDLAGRWMLHKAQQDTEG